MKAIVYDSNNRCFKEEYMEKPIPTGKDLLVQVKAVSVNPIDLKIKQKRNLGVLGWDISGVVESVGSDVTLFQPGDEIYYAGSIDRPGGNIEYHLVDERLVGKKPRNLDFISTASLPLNGLTAWEALFDRLNISMNSHKNKGKTLLIIGAAGGVGSIAIQLAKEVGLTVIGTGSRSISFQWMQYLGVSYAIHHFRDFSQQLSRQGFESVDYILCCGDTTQHWEAMCKLIASEGKICSIVETSQKLDFSLLQKKSATYTFQYVFTRPIFKKNAIKQHQILNQLAKWVEEGKLRPTDFNHLQPINAKNMLLAHQWVESKKTIGKVVVHGFNE